MLTAKNGKAHVDPFEGRFDKWLDRIDRHFDEANRLLKRMRALVVANIIITIAGSGLIVGLMFFIVVTGVR